VDLPSRRGFAIAPCMKVVDSGAPLIVRYFVDSGSPLIALL